MKPTDYKAIRYTVFLLLFVVFSSNKVVCQDFQDRGLVNFKKGLIAQKDKDYIRADSLYRISILQCPMPETYYNLAMTRKYLKDVCGYCNYLDSASEYEMQDAIKLFKKNCIIRDSIFYDSTLYKDYYCYSIITTQTCSPVKKIEFYIKYINESNFNKVKSPANDESSNNKTRADVNPFILYKTSTNDSIIAEAMNKNFFFSIDKIKNNSDDIYVCLKEMPQFPGGESGLISYFEKNTNYPEFAKEYKIKGKVFVSFIINEQGNVERVKVKRKVHPLLDAEAIRVIKRMPKWQPGMQCGKPVKVAFTVPINFAIY